MNFYKFVSEGFILSILTSDFVLPLDRIEETEYNDIVELINRKPADGDSYLYKIKDSTKRWNKVDRPQSDVADSSDEDLIF